MANSPLKSTEWLAKNLGKNELIILDASYHLPDAKRVARKEYETAHIPGAQFFDIEKIADPNASQPHTLPRPKDFGVAVGALGVSNSSKVVIYDNSDIRTAARAWWMFRIMGHRNVYVLSGGMQRWQAQNKKLQKGTYQAETEFYKGIINTSFYFTKEDVLKNLETKEYQIVDARAAGRFQGTLPEPREGMRAGHIPDALNLPYSSLYAPDGALLNTASLSEKINEAGIDLNKPIATSCGSGITACCLALAFACLGKWDTAIYDGSWSEWGADSSLPLETETE